MSCQFFFKLLLCIGVLIDRDSESKTNITTFNTLPGGCIHIRTLSLVSLGGLGSVRPSGSSSCDLPPAAGWEAGLQADQLLTSWDEHIRFCTSAQKQWSRVECKINCLSVIVVLFLGSLTEDGRHSKMFCLLSFEFRIPKDVWAARSNKGYISIRRCTRGDTGSPPCLCRLILFLRV